MCLRNAGHNDGLTLTELLTVVAIVAVISSISVPAFMQMGFFSKDKPTESVRELYALLRAARVYAAANGVTAGVVYARGNTFDIIHNPDTNRRPYVDSAAMVRAFKTEEKRNFGLSQSGNVFVSVQNDNGNFRPMLEGTCAFLTRQEDSPDVDLGNSALGKVYLYDGIGDVVVADAQDLDNDGDRTDSVPFYGHFFKPSGEMVDPSGGAFTKERFFFEVGTLEKDELESGDTVIVPIGFIRSTGRIWIGRD